MTYVIHYSEISKPQATWLDGREATADFMEALPDEQSAFIVEDEKDLDQVPAKALVAIYNAANPDHKPITKFSDRATARTRTWPMLPRITVHDREAPELKKAVREAIDESPETAPTPHDEAVQKMGEDDFDVAMKEADAEKKAKGSPAKGKRLGVGVRMAELLKAGKGTNEVLEVIHAEFPDSRARASDVSIIRKKVRDGKL